MESGDGVWKSRNTGTRRDGPAPAPAPAPPPHSHQASGLRSQALALCRGSAKKVITEKPELKTAQEQPLAISGGGQTGFSTEPDFRTMRPFFFFFDVTQYLFTYLLFLQY